MFKDLGDMPATNPETFFHKNHGLQENIILFFLKKKKKLI